MKAFISRALVTSTFFCLSGIAWADSVREVFTCELEDDKTIEDVQAANGKWLAWVRKNISDEISSAVLTAIVGNQDGFLFVDTYPSLTVWAETKEALDTEEGEAIEENFEGLFDCDDNRLWKHEPTK